MKNSKTKFNVQVTLAPQFKKHMVNTRNALAVIDKNGNSYSLFISKKVAQALIASGMSYGN